MDSLKLINNNNRIKKMKLHKIKMIKTYGGEQHDGDIG